jgi:LysR family transcriptional regulator, glycine cleavage system transcriptional activator
LESKLSHRLPPLNNLKSFEAAARHLSFTRAADELGVTPGAVSQQVKSLEAVLGIKVFRRLSRSLVLTDEGEAYLPAINSAFQAISRATEQVAPALRGRKLRLGVAPRVLKIAADAVGKLRQPASRSDAIILKITDDLAELMNGKLDALLRPSGGAHPGFNVERIDLTGVDGAPTSVSLVTLPGLAGCHEHRRLMRRLKDAA